MKLTITLELEPDFEGFKVKLNGHELKSVNLPEHKTCNKKCLKCGKEFTCTSNAQKFCSHNCGMKAHKKEAVKKLKQAQKTFNDIVKMAKDIKVPIQLKKPLEPIEKTLAEIDENQRRREATPYEFNT